MSTIALQRPRWRPLIVLALCITGTLTGALLLYRDFSRSNLSGDGPQVAVLESLSRGVRRKARTSFLWGKTESGAPLFRRDAIRVGPEGSASIRLSDGSLLEVGENSLVVIEDVSQLPLSFLQGSFVVRKSTGDTLVSVDTQGQAKTEVVPVRLLKPATQAFFFTAENQLKAIDMEWEGGKGIALPWDRLQVSAFKDFPKRATQEFKLNPSLARTSISLSAGSYFWRILSGETAVTETRRLRVVTARPLQSISPTAAESLVTWQKATRIPFRWEVPTGSRDRVEALALERIPAQLEVSTSADFAKRVFETPVSASAGSAWIAAVPQGEYFWRLKSSFPGMDVHSRTLKFRIAAAEKMPIQLQLPTEGSTVEKGTPIAFRWRLDGVAARYRLELERAGQKIALPNRKTASEDLIPSYQWPAMDPGSYRWRVIATMDEQIVGESKWRRFEVLEGRPILLTAPEPNRKFEYWAKPEPYAFHWQADEKSGQYKVEIARDAEFKQVVKTATATHPPLAAQAFDLGAGDWFWRVRWVDSADRTLRVSAISRFQHAPFDRLKAPEDAYPPEKYVFLKDRANLDPEIKWSSLKDAKQYVVKLRHGKRIVREIKTDQTTVKMKGVTPGLYQWTLHAVDPGGREGEALAWRELTVTPPKKLRAPKLIVK